MAAHALSQNSQEYMTRRDLAHSRAHEILADSKRDPNQCSKLILLIMRLESINPNITEEEIKNEAIAKGIMA